MVFLVAVVDVVGLFVVVGIVVIVVVPVVVLVLVVAAAVIVGHRNLTLKFCQNRIDNIGDTVVVV